MALHVPIPGTRQPCLDRYGRREAKQTPGAGVVAVSNRRIAGRRRDINADRPLTAQVLDTVYKLGHRDRRATTQVDHLVTERTLQGSNHPGDNIVDISPVAAQPAAVEQRD